MENRFRFSRGVRNLQIFVLAAVSIVTFAALTLPSSLQPRRAPGFKRALWPRRNINAPRDAEYVSQSRTEEARQTGGKSGPACLHRSRPGHRA